MADVTKKGKRKTCFCLLLRGILTIQKFRILLPLQLFCPVCDFAHFVIHQTFWWSLDTSIKTSIRRGAGITFYGATLAIFNRCCQVDVYGFHSWVVMSHNHCFLKPECRCVLCLAPQAVSEEGNLSLGLGWRSVANTCLWACCALLEHVCF